MYVAYILNALKGFAGIPYPSTEFKNLKVFFPYYTCKSLTNAGNEKLLYQFKSFKITKDKINNEPEKFVVIVRPNMIKDLEKIANMNGGNFIYTMWEGYLKKDKTKEFVEYLTKRNFTMYQIHTSGHADTVALKEMIEAIKPKHIVPIHTFSRDEYSDIFSAPIFKLNDGETVTIN